MLGYYSTNEKRDGRYRRIEVKLGQPGLQVRARRGYMAPRGKAPAPAKVTTGNEAISAAMRDAINSPLQEPGLPMTVFAAPFKGTAPNASIVIVTQVQGSAIPFTSGDGKLSNALEVSYVLVDGKGDIKAAKSETVKLGLKPETYQRVQAGGFRVQSRAEVPPGKYQLRLAAREVNGGRTGSVFYDLEVPDFAKEPLAMSGLALTSASSSQVPTAGVDPLLKELLPAPPTTSREFQTRDELALMTEVYDNVGPQSHKVEITATLRADDGRVVFKTSEERASSELGGKPGGYGYAARIPLKDVKPGLYVLRVDARSSLGKEASTAREVLLRVVP